jgi:hypothetical protein
MSTEIATRSAQIAAVRRPARTYNLRIIPRRRTRHDVLAEYGDYVRRNWRNMTPAQAGAAGEQIARMAGRAATRPMIGAGK